MAEQTAAELQALIEKGLDDAGIDGPERVAFRPILTVIVKLIADHGRLADALERIAEGQERIEKLTRRIHDQPAT